MEKIWLNPAAKPNPKALEVIEKADLIIIGPGGFYYSLIPNFLVEGIVPGVYASSAKKIYIENLVAQIPGFNYVEELKKYISLDVVLPATVQKDSTTLAHAILTS